MTDEQKKSLDLETAQRLYIAAGHPDQARAAGFVIDAVRNTVQGEWGTSFVASLEGLLVRHINPLIEGQKETHSGIAALSSQFQTLAETVDGLQASMRDSQADRKTLHETDAEILKEVAGVKADVANLQDQFQSMQEQFSRYIGGSKREEVEELKAQVRELRGDLPPEQRQHYIDILMHIITEWEAAHAPLEERGERPTDG